MERRMLAWVGIMLGVVVFSAASVMAADETKTKAEGTIVSVAEAEVTIKNAAGENKTFKVAEACSVTIDDKPAKLADLKPGMKATLTNGKDNSCEKISAKSSV